MIQSIFKNVFFRNKFYQTNIFSGTTLPTEVALAKRALRNGLCGYKDGPHIQIFERRLADIVEVSEAITFATGRMALYAIMQALNIGEGCEVVVPAYTCAVVPNAIIYRGAQPVYVDIEKERFSIDPSKLKKVITARSKAIIAQHTYGIPCFIDEIKEVADSYNIPIIEDCALALGGSLKGRPLGSIGTAAFFSFDHTKVISTTSGGAAVTSDKDLSLKLKRIQQKSLFVSDEHFKKMIRGYIWMHRLTHPRWYWFGRYFLAAFSRLNFIKWFWDPQSVTLPKEYPFPARYSDLQAQIGLSQLEHLSENLSWRLRTALAFEEAIRANTSLFNNSDISPVWLRYPFLVDNRNVFLEAVSTYHELGSWFTTIAQGREGNFEEIGYKLGSCPVAEEVTTQIVSPSTHMRMIGLNNLLNAMEMMHNINGNVYHYNI